MPHNIIGISAHFHDSACCLLQDGILVAAAEEERFTRRKHDPSIPKAAFRYCLKQGGVSIDEIDCVAYYEDPVKKIGRQLWTLLPGQSSGAGLERLDPCRPEREIRDVLGYHGILRFVDHHQAHAASSFYYSGFSDAAIMTVDGVGEWAAMTYGSGSAAGLEIFEEVEFPDSLGLLYSTITGYLGFSVNDGEYKVMGLAPYGNPAHVREIRTLVELRERGQIRLNLEYFDFRREDRMHSERMIELFGRPVRERESEISQFHMDVARSLQVVLEEFLLEKVAYLHGCVPSENLCLAGGVALNCVANGRLRRDGPFRRLFVQPAASDAGGALGAAAVAHYAIPGAVPIEPMANAYLGPCFTSHDVQNLLHAAGIAAQDFRGDEEVLCKEAAERLAAGQVLGWFDGRMEFGPRALGSRSILADPRNPNMRDHINALVKKRESFRPFAPAVLETRAAEHFDLDHPSPFMLETCQVRSALDLPAITHVDQSARVQTVSPDTNPRFARLLAAFERRTGCPVLVNTSFNMRDEPIVCSPLDALICFVRADIDALVLGDFLIDRDSLDPHWAMMVRTTSGTAEMAVSHHVYTFL
jgi:carbamoyltransferase